MNRYMLKSPPWIFQIGSVQDLWRTKDFEPISAPMRGLPDDPPLRGGCPAVICILSLNWKRLLYIVSIVIISYCGGAGREGDAGNEYGSRERESGRGILLHLYRPGMPEPSVQTFGRLYAVHPEMPCNAGNSKLLLSQHRRGETNGRLVLCGLCRTCGKGGGEKLIRRTEGPGLSAQMKFYSKRTA